MSNRFGSSYDNEPVIGATYPPDDEPVIGGSYPPDEPAPPTIGGYTGEPYYEDDEFAGEDGYWDDEYYADAEPPARQPMFYLFLFLAAVVGGVLVFLVLNLVRGDGGNSGTPATEFAVQIESPTRDQRLEINREHEAIVQASATVPLRRFELFVGDRVVDAIDLAEVPPDNRYRATLRFTLPGKGTYELFVRVFAESGASKDSAKVRVVAIEPVGERPQSIQGRVVADATLREGPGDTFAEAGSLRAGAQVTITGKTRDLSWLLVQPPAGRAGWVRRAAIEPLDTLDLVPVRDVTPTPVPTATATPEPSPTATVSPSPSPSANAPDFVPTNAVLASGGAVLRVTVSNVSNNAYSGPLVVAVGGDVPQQELAVNVNLPANGGSTVVEFPVSPPITQPEARAVVTVDPANIVREQREDNNGATFVLQPPVEAPNLVITSATVTTTTVDVVVRNDGGPLPVSTVVVQVQLGGETTSKSVSIALATGQSSPVISVARPAGSGQATVTVYVGNQPLASTTVQLP
ncbi:CARDB domain-containing protein [Tepidiforma thermophila]|uniref:CARDB protein n=1 Tax=Tepidiforma thermophila (strain KCTC 52669 / CGMCC 1.13589 / G233) TaxID=2761530 RepID=A0A2A9HHQ2_TEPT2|nr:CARDB domain-containing protein [Tepidiforma thermophila]PFG74630.1 CARDB protein [Tepidiforma thermophila]